MPQRKLDVVLDSVRRLQRMGATANLVNLLQKQHPADLAQLFSELPHKDRHSAFSLLVERNPRLAMEALSELEPETGATLLADRSAEEIVKLTQELPSDDAAAIIDYLPKELSAEVLELMQKRPAGGEVGELLEYDEQTAGRIMNPKVFALSEEMTAGEAISALQGSRDVEVVFYLYVVDGRRHLVGVVSLRRLLLVSPSTPLKRIMTTDLISVRAEMDQEEVARQVASYNLLAIPVVDEENKLVGVITVDDIIDVIKDEATEDVYRLAGRLGRRSRLHVALRLAPQAAPLADGQPRHGVRRRARRQPLRRHDCARDRAGRLHARRRRDGRQRRHPDTDGDRARDRAWRTHVEQHAAGAAEGSGGRGGQRDRLRDHRRADRVAGLRQPDARADSRDGHDHQHVRGGGGRHAHSAGAARAEDRPGAGLGRLHHDADRRLRILVVSRAGDTLPAVPAFRGVEWRVPVYTSDALILRTYKLGESDRIVVFLTRDRGKKRGVAKGARRPKSRFVGALEPMTRAGVAYYEREQRDLVRINYVEPTRSPLAAPTAEALGHVGYFAELIDEWAPEAQADERLYRLGASMTDAVAAGVPVQELARYFEYWILRLQGVYPSITVCPGCRGSLAEGGRMPPGEHAILCVACAASGRWHGDEPGGAGVSAGGTARRARTAGRPRPVATGGEGTRNGAPPPPRPAPRKGTQVGPGPARDATVVC
jgi:DNA repair protein RecO